MNVRWVALAASMAAVTVSAQPASVDLQSKVIGNQEQPRVMVIVPWQDVAGPNELFKEFIPQAQDDSGLLERDTFLRELDYRRQIEPSAGQ